MVDIAKNISEMSQVITDSMAMDPTKGVANLQLAGNISVEVTGPAIDQFSGSNPAVMNFTQMAWKKNGELAGTSDISTAKTAFQQMMDWYSQAYQLALQSVHPATAAVAAATQQASAYHATGAIATPLAPVASSKNFPTVPTLVGVVAGIVGFSFAGPIGALVAGALGFGVTYEVDKKS